MKVITHATTVKKENFSVKQGFSVKRALLNFCKTEAVLRKSNRLLFFMFLFVICLLPPALTNADFYTEASISGSEFSAGCWVSPTAPVLVSLPNNSVIHQGNPWLSNSLMNWDASTINCPNPDLQYQFIVATDNAFSTVVQTSSWLNTTQFVTSANTSGEFYWKVLVRDSAHLNITPVESNVFHYTVDLSDLQAPQNTGWNSQASSSAPDETPVDLSCGATTDNTTLSHLWTLVTGNNVKYQRELTKPDNSTTTSIEPNNYTSFTLLGSFPDIAGVWKARIRAFEDDNNNGQFDSGERVSAYSDYCNITFEQATPSAKVVLNEILPDPQGTDNFALPFGEWVEIYNRSDDPIDVNGWKISADPTNEYPLIINVTNTFEGVAVGIGTTTIQPHGFLVVYRAGDPNFDLKNIPDGVTDSETVRLFNSSDELQDETTYTNTRENKSMTRIPDGFDNWVDPIPSPGRPNVLEEKDLEPFAFVVQKSAQEVGFALVNAINYDTADVTIRYKRKEEGEEILEALTKHIDITENIQFSSDLFLGSASTNSAFAHKDIHDLEVEIVLHSANLPDEVISTKMKGKWK